MEAASLRRLRHARSPADVDVASSNDVVSQTIQSTFTGSCACLRPARQLLTSRDGSASCRPSLGRPPSAGAHPGLGPWSRHGIIREGLPMQCIQATARHPADRRLADVRRLVLTRASGPGAAAESSVRGCPRPESRRMVTSEPGWRSAVTIRVSGGQGCPQRTSGDGAWAAPNRRQRADLCRPRQAGQSCVSVPFVLGTPG